MINNIVLPIDLENYFDKQPYIERRTSYNTIVILTVLTLIFLCLTVSMILYHDFLLNFVKGYGYENSLAKLHKFLILVSGGLTFMFAYNLICYNTGIYDTNIQSFISQLGTKKFNTDTFTEEELVDLVKNKEFKKITETPEYIDGNLTIERYVNPKAKMFYVQAVRTIDSDNNEGISEIYIISGDDFDKYENDLYAIW